MTPFVQQHELRASFARALSDMYAKEVPAYGTLLEVATAVNADVLASRGLEAERLGSIDRVSAERHGAIRVGTREELRDVGTLFAGFGMHPVGFYDLRDASSSSVPVVSTAFRPLDSEELALNPFRVFTSVLVVEDQRFFNPDLQARLNNFLAARQLFGPRVLELAREAERSGGLDAGAAAEFVESATASFELGRDAVDRAWYEELAQVSAVAADIGGVTSTHINHLTPRVLDIDELYRRMTARGTTMIDTIQGPPKWDGPDVLLRQTSFKALAEPRLFTEADGTVAEDALRVRFGEVESRGIALTRRGRQLYDTLLQAVDAGSPAEQVWRENLPTTEAELDRQGLGSFTYSRTPGARSEKAGDIHDLVDAGSAVRTPIVYEDFLPRSAAGIFQSNLSAAGTKDASEHGAHRDAGWISDVLGREVHDPHELYAAQTRKSLSAFGL